MKINYSNNNNNNNETTNAVKMHEEKINRKKLF